MMGLKIVVE